jgi:hypothetical protein
MFDLETSVISWRATLPENIRRRADVVDELEQHLRDDFERRIAKGAQPDDAWIAAITSLGSPNDLAREFDSAQSSSWTPVWLVNAAAAVLTLSLCYIVFSMRHRPLLAAHVALITTGYCAVFAVGFLAVIAAITRAISGWSAARQRAFQSAGRKLALVAAATTLAGVALGTVWAHIHMGRWWAWDEKEVGGACVLAWSVLLVRCFAPTSRLNEVGPMLLGVIGNAVVAVSWFGPVVFNPRHSYGLSPTIPGAVLGIFVIAQMGIVYLSLLPAGIFRLNPANRLPQ